MVLMSDATPATRHARPRTSAHPSVAKAGRRDSDNRRKSQKEQLSSQEEERRRIRRERNKIAAAKCRNRRRELTETLQEETDHLEEDKAALETEIASLLKEKEELERILSTHQPHCKLPEDCEEGLESPPLSPSPERSQDPESPPSPRDLEKDALVPSNCLSPVSTSAISGDSDILLCATAEMVGAELDPPFDMRLGPVLEEEDSDRLRGDDMELELGLLVPDVELGSTLALGEWVGIYESMAGHLEPLTCTPDLTCSPDLTCTSNSLSMFGYNDGHFEASEEACEGLKGAVRRSELAQETLSSPTLLAL